MKHFLFILAALILATAAQARTLVVNPAMTNASDSNPGSDTQPLRTISRAAALVQPGDGVTIYAGVYREQVAIKQSGTREQPIRFEAAPGALVVVTGADVLTGWTKDNDHSYSVDWPHQLYQGDDHNPRGTEQVFVNRQLYVKVPSLAAMTNGTFFVDLAGKRLHLFTANNLDEDPSMQPVEGSTRGSIWTVTGADVHTRGLIFRYSATRAQQGMAQFKGARDLLEDCVFEWSNSTGATFVAPDLTVLRCVFQDNGQQGFSGSNNDRLRMDGCTAQRNNNKEFPRGWEAGGNKMCMSRGVIYENCRFINNHGCGVWFDISNMDATIRNCLIADNEDAGIFYEISYGLHAHDNVIVGNGLRPSPGSWGANGGVCISSSPGCVIERNLIIGNGQGFCFREQDRTTPRIDGTKGPEVAIWNHDEVVRNNMIINNRSGQVQGWFDIGTERHWPKAMQTGRGSTNKAKEDVAAGYQARADGVPAGLSLEDLKISFLDNIYAVVTNQPFFIWGVDWKPKIAFKDIPSLMAALGFETQHSQILSSFPADPTGRDFRLQKELFEVVKNAWPQGKVPDCTLGITGSQRTEGAGKPLFADTHFQKGFLLSGSDSSKGRAVESVLNFGDTNNVPAWRLCQWATKYSLAPAQCVRSNGTFTYENSGKRVAVCYSNTDNKGLILEVRGSAEYGARARKANESWPHLLVEQDAIRLDALDALQELRLRVRVRLLHSKSGMAANEYDPGLHAAQFQLFFIVKNIRPGSVDQDNYYWFGVPFYDNRYDVPPAFMAADTGKKDATGKFIYTVGGGTLGETAMKTGQWMTMDVDLLPYILKGLQEAANKGYLKNANPHDYAVANMNMGWEIPGTFDAAVQVQDLEITAMSKQGSNDLK